MSLIRRFFGDDHNLQAVDLSSAPRFTMNLSGSQLTFPRPRQTVKMPVEVQQYSVECLSGELTSCGDDMLSNERIHFSGWDFFGRQKESLGYVTVEISVEKPLNLQKGESLFDPAVLKRWMMSQIEAGYWVKQNEVGRALNDWHPDKKRLYRYPQSEQEIDCLEHLAGYRFQVVKPRLKVSHSISHYYMTPLNDESILTFLLIAEAVNTEFFSSEHNFAEASDQFIKEFMSLVTLELSAEAKFNKHRKKIGL